MCMCQVSKLSECEKVVLDGMFTVRLYFVKNNKLQFYFPEDENSTCQSG